LTAAGGNAGTLGEGLLGSTGEAMAAGPWGITDDGNGNIYWTDYGSPRVRVATTGGSAMTLFGPSISGTMSVYASDPAAALTTSAAASLTAQSSAAAAATYGIYGPNQNVAGACVNYVVTNLAAGPTAATVAAPTVVTLTSAGGTFYPAGSGCVGSVGTVTIPTGKAWVGFQYKTSGNGTTPITATTSGITGNLVVTAASTAAPAKLAIFPPTYMTYTDCVPVTLQMQTAGATAATNTLTRNIQVQNNGTGTWYSDSACATAPAFTFSFPSGQAELVVYYSRAIKANANSAVALAGIGASNGFTAGNAASPPALGVATFRQPRGIAVATSGGSVTAIYVGDSDNNRVSMINTTASAVTIGGTTVNATGADTVFGNGTAAYIGDGMVANITEANWIQGLALDYNKHHLLIADTSNDRVRTLDLTTTSGLAQTILGAGYARSQFSTDAAVPAPTMVFNNPGPVVMDNANRSLYISDVSNNRIRIANMLTGYVQTAASRGWGNETTQNDDPLSEFMRYPKGMTLLQSGGAQLLLYADNLASTGGGQNCFIRAWNQGSSGVTVFNTLINAGKVSTVAGNFVSGCNSWVTAPANTNGMAATSAQLYNPEAVATDGTTLYVTDYNDHCIVKVNVAAGTISTFIGTCGPVPNPATDGFAGSTATTRYPTGIWMDTLSGYTSNFFFVDSIDLNTGRIRYVNNVNQSLSIGGITIPAANPTPTVTTVATLIPANISPLGAVSSRLYGVATFANQVCYASGNYANGGDGAHNVTCIDRTSNIGAVTLRVGPNESNLITRAGSPLGMEQEAISSSQALIGGPYGITFDSQGNLYFTERMNGLVRMVGRWFQ
jgi:hypothetical protein